MKTPRDYQRAIVSKTEKSKGNVLIKLPTGGGKTFIALMIARRAGKVLFLAPKVNLLEQTYESFKELNPQIIKGLEPYDRKAKAFVSTLQTISRRPHLLKELNIDTVIIDEVHYGYNGNMQNIIRESHKGKFIGLSATPYTSTGKLIEGFDVVVDEFDISYLIEKGYLVPVEAICPFELDLRDVKITAGDYNLKELDYKMSSMEMITAVVDTTVKIISKKKKTIVFCVTIDHCNILAEAYEKRFELLGKKKNIRVMHSKTDKAERKSILDGFSNGDIDIIVSVDMITTGFDAPNTDSIVLARPTKSQVLYKQIVGRGTRPYPQGKKEFCLMLDCGNVIDNLGMPIAPIVEIEKKSKEDKLYDSVCPHCAKKRKVKIVSYENDENLYNVCCYCLKDIEFFDGLSVIKCPYCNFAHSHKTHPDSILITKDGIGLKCRNCKRYSVLTIYSDSIGSFRELAQVVNDKIERLIKSGKINIFYKSCFRKYLPEAVYSQEWKYAKLFYTEQNDEVFYDALKKDIKSSQMNKCVKNTQPGIFAQAEFVDFCTFYIPNMDFQTKLESILRGYAKKHNGEDMPYKLYKDAALWLIKKIKQEQGRISARNKFCEICNKSFPCVDFIPTVERYESLYRNKHNQMMPYELYESIALWHVSKAQNKKERKYHDG